MHTRAPSTYTHTHTNHFSTQSHAMDGSLSPFLERPSRLNAMSGAKENVSRLEYELSAVKTEKKLLQQSKDSSIARYEELLSRKNAELSQLQANFDFVYNQRKELQLKIKNQQQVSGKSSEDLSLKLKQLNAENKTLHVKLDQCERQYQAMSGKCQHIRADLNRELATNDQYRERNGFLEEENGKLTRINDSLLQRVQSLSARLESGDAEKKVHELQLSLVSLKKVADELQTKCDVLLQRKYNNELLKQKIASLTSKVQAAEKVQTQFDHLKSSHAELNAKFNDYFGLISAQLESSGEEDVLNFIQSFKSLQNKNLIISNKIKEREVELTEKTQHVQDLNSKIEKELSPLIEDLKHQVNDTVRERNELLKMLTLNRKEIEFLRKSLRDLDNVVSSQKSVTSGAETQNPEKKDAVDQYMSNLEKLVDEYRQELDQVRHNSSVTSGLTLPTKRPRLIDDDEDQDAKSKNLVSLRSENLDLLTQVKNLEDKVQSLSTQLSQNANHPAGSNVLELRVNPFAKDQLLKQEVLDTLRRENEGLVAKFINSQEVETVPKSVFARQENDKDIMQTKIDQLLKKIDRLKSIYADKSREIITMMSSYFGYTIEFIPSPLNPHDVCSRIKLVSRYMIQLEPTVNPPYLLIDVRLRSLKAHGSYEFKSICEELVDQWVGEKNQIPCFLSALNLKIYDQYGRNN